MPAFVVSDNQREILEALAGRWELCRWRCNDGTPRWHLGVDEVDGRSIFGLRQRGLIDWNDGYDRLVLTERGREALQWEADHPDGVISAEEDEAMARYAYEACREEGCT
jgi:hypothetical protein